MFVVCRKLPGDQRWCVLVCQSVRTGCKVLQKTIKYFGIVRGEEQRKIVVEQAKREMSILQANDKPRSTKLSLNSPAVKVVEHCDGVLLGNLVELRRTTEGFHDILGPVFDNILLKPLLTKIRYNQLKDVVIARIAEPASKLRTAKILQNTFYKQLSDDQIYRLMDEIVDLEDAIKTKIFDATQLTLGSKSIELLLFDVTTLYFESQKRDELREFGYSKDHKIGETQVVLALATTAGGLPIGYHLFQGNTAETSTLLQCLKKWRELFDISRVVVVADRAMMSEANLRMMEDNNLTYVVAAKLKSLPKALKTKILERKHEISEDLFGERINIQEHDHKGRRLVVQYSDNRAKKDASDRERLVEKVRKKLNSSNKIDTQRLVTNRGYLKFVDKAKDGEVVLNEDKIAEDELWDGLHGVITNDKESTAICLLGRYRNLWAIEESFKINKHTLSMRPIYHFTPKRIKAHILICYLAFAVIRYTHQRIKAHNHDMSIESIRDALAGVESSIVEDRSTRKHYILPSKLCREAKILYEAMGIEKATHPRKMVS